MLQWEHSVILSTFIKLPFLIKIFVLSIFDWPLRTGFSVFRCVVVVVVVICCVVIYADFHRFVNKKACQPPTNSSKSSLLVSNISKEEGKDQGIDTIKYHNLPETPNGKVEKTLNACIVSQPK